MKRVLVAGAGVAAVECVLALRELAAARVSIELLVPAAELVHRPSSVKTPSAASRHGATHDIAEAIASGLNRRGVTAEVRPTEEAGALDGYDAFVIGSAVYVGHWLEPARALIERHASLLSERPVWLFSSGRSGRRRR